MRNLLCGGNQYDPNQNKVHYLVLVHRNNPHKGSYDFNLLQGVYPPLKDHMVQKEQGGEIIQFSDPASVLALNTAVLVAHYDIERWAIPAGHLCPPIPGRADYIHHIAEFIYAQPSTLADLPIQCMDIGTGASLIYPIVGSKAYNWSFTGTDIDKASIKNAQAIIDRNKRLRDKVTLRHQANASNIFTGIITSRDHFDLSICNPPFFKSAEETASANKRKNKNLHKKYPQKTDRVFQGTPNELWCTGGERQFITTMIKESYNFRHQCRWFSTLVSNQRNLLPLEKALNQYNNCTKEIIHMALGQKSSHILVWGFNQN